MDDLQSLDAAVIYAKKYLEDMLSFFGLNTEVHATTEEDVIELNVPSTHMNGFLIGQRGETMRALQFMTSMSLKSKGYEFSRVNVDVANYKAGRHERLGEKVEEWVKQVKDSGEPMHLRPMNAADRRIVHKVAAENGLNTESEGDGRNRHVVLAVDSSSNQEATKEEKEESEE